MQQMEEERRSAEAHVRRAAEEERQHLEELRRRMEKERQSAETSARQAADKEKRELLRARKQLEMDKDALMDEKEEQRRHLGERWRLLQCDGGARGAVDRSAPRDLEGAALRSSPIPDSPSKRSKAALARQSRMSVDHEVRAEAKGKAELRRKVKEIVEILRSEDMSVKVKRAVVTLPKELTSDAKAARKGPLVKPKDFDGTTPVEDFLQQIKACSKYYCWSDEECSIHLRCALIGDAVTLV